jgi:hypothetical protein
MAFPLLLHVTRGRPSKKWDSGVSKICHELEDVELFDGNITVFRLLIGDIFGAENIYSIAAPKQEIRQFT